MNRIASRSPIAALGIGLVVAIAGAQVSVAQPRSLPANPQTQDRAPDRQDQQYDRRDGGQYDSRAGRRDEDRLERRLAFLHSQLRITAAQEPSWVAFANVLREERDRARDKNSAERDRFRDASVVERLEDRQRMLADRTADLDRVVRALRPLYASFSEDQRRTADRMMFRPGEGRGGAGGRQFEDGGRGGPGFDRDRDPDRGGYPDNRR